MTSDRRSTRPFEVAATSGVSGPTPSRPTSSSGSSAAAHAAPSVGHSQPWRFVVVRDAATRDRAALLADREWHRQAARIDDRSARHMLDLQLHGIRDAPVGVVVCCDRRTPAEGVLGRATYVDADLWSCACAIENLWLAARAEGVGVGLGDPVPARRAGGPGRPAARRRDARVALPGLARRAAARTGSGTRRAGRRASRCPRSCCGSAGTDEEGDTTPPPPPSHLQAPAPGTVVAARDEADVLLTPPGSLGALDRALDRLSRSA